MGIRIRQEQATDVDAIDDVVRAAFAAAVNKNGNEHELVQKLRVGDTYIPELALVAEEDGKIIGFIMFTKVWVNDHEELALAPLSVQPSAQGQGIGGKLIQSGHEIAADLGYHYSIVLGSEDYYPTFGYVPAADFGIVPPFDVPSNNFMVYELNKPEEPVVGTVQYPDVFFE